MTDRIWEIKNRSAIHQIFWEIVFNTIFAAAIKTIDLMHLGKEIKNLIYRVVPQMT
jgi:hypothetical protein